MRIAIAVFLILHGIAHLPGFLVSWRITTFKETPYRTTLLSGRFDVGDMGMRLIGALWLIIAIAFALTGAAMIADTGWWGSAAIWVTLTSLILTLLSLPEARIGAAVDVAVLALLAVSGAVGWLHIF